MIKRKGTTKHVLVLSGDNLRPEAVNQLRTSLGITDQVHSGLILTEGVNYVGRYEIGNADDRKLSRRHVQFTVQPGVLYKHVTVCLLGTNPSVFQRIRDDGFKEKFFMEKDKTYTLAPGDVVWLLKDLYPLKLEEIMVTVQARSTSSTNISESPTAKNGTGSPSHSNPDTFSEFPQNQQLEPEVPRNSEDLFAQEMSAMIEELREQYLQSIQTKSPSPNQNINQNGSANSTPNTARRTPSLENPPLETTSSPDHEKSSPKFDFKKELRSSKELLHEKKMSRAEELDMIKRLYVATLQRAEEEHRRIEALKEQLKEATEKVMKIHVIAQTKRAGVSDENANSKTPSKKDSRKTLVIAQDSSTTIGTETREDLFLDFDSLLVTYEARKNATTTYSSPTPTLYTPLPSQLPSAVATPTQSNSPTRTNSYTQIPELIPGAQTPNKVTRSGSPLKNELSNDDLNQILSRTRSNSQFVFPSSIKTSTSNLLGSSSKPIAAIPIFPGITLETQDVVEFQMSTDVRKQLAKLNQQPTAKQRSATAGRAPKQRSTVIGRQSSESIGQNKSP